MRLIRLILSNEHHAPMSQKSKKNLVDAIISGKGNDQEYSLTASSKKQLSFENLDVDSIRPKKQGIEYASVKIRQELYDRVKSVAQKQGIKQPGKFISLVLETFLEQAEE